MSYLLMLDLQPYQNGFFNNLIEICPILEPVKRIEFTNHSMKIDRHLLWDWPSVQIEPEVDLSFTTIEIFCNNDSLTIFGLSLTDLSDEC